ncbi:MAG: carbamoyl-phosphate synthase large subunit [Euryarchaeota archaeon]|nr:carbamoyl-phosphate synthase large subunit [Euryarchaeota archaeon]
MPKRTDLRKVMIIGSGPIVIGQAAEFDFSGSQACRSLREEGYGTVLVNSNPATIQTDPEMADAVYVEPLTAGVLTRIIEKERPQGILSGMGGQTGLNMCAELGELGVLDRYGVELLGTQLSAIATSEDRDLFRQRMVDIGEPIPRSFACGGLDEAKLTVKKLGGYPVIIRAAYTLGGTGSGIARAPEELEHIVSLGLAYSRIRQVLVEECVLGWMEFEYEVMRDRSDNCITVCNMENLDPMGIHTGESIVIAPAQTLSDPDHQMLRSAALKIIRALRIEGGCNIQFALDFRTGEYRVIEVNPRVSRSSALASKATGYPIARVAAKIAVGMTLDEIPNAITGRTFSSFEPSLDYCVLKIPRWPFDKFRTADRRLGTSMKSTGEVMAIGRCIEEALLKAVRSLEVDRVALEPEKWSTTELIAELVEPSDKRLYAIAEALRRGFQPATVSDLTKWDVFWLHKLQNILAVETRIQKEREREGGLSEPLLREAKRLGFSDEYIADLLEVPEESVRSYRRSAGLLPAFKMVDTCAAEFEARTPYFYSTYGEESDIEGARRKAPGARDEGAGDKEEGTRVKGGTDGTPEGPPLVPCAPSLAPSPLAPCALSPEPLHKKKILIIGSGPIRIGQGVEFDYCCVHAVQAIREEGLFAIMANNNPETVSTDFDTADRLYFEPLTFEDVWEIIELERPGGVVVQFGGQTSIDLAVPLHEALGRRPDLPTRLLGTSSDSIDIAEDRGRFREMTRRMGILQPDSDIGRSVDEVRAAAHRMGFPVLLRPSYVLGGRGMMIIHDDEELELYMKTAVRVSGAHPVLIDRYLSSAIEIDVDVVADGGEVFIGAIMEHIEEAGVHSGDAACVIPPQTLQPETVREIERITIALCMELGVVGLANLQLAVKDGKVYVLEVNPRASRTVPFVSKAVGVPMAKVAMRVMLGKTLGELGLSGTARSRRVSVKAPVFPFMKLPGVDAILGPEMKSTGEVMGTDEDFGMAYYKALLSAGLELPPSGNVFITVSDADKEKAVQIARSFSELGYGLLATRGTAAFLRERGIAVTTIFRISERSSPDSLDLMRRGEIGLVINTPSPDKVIEKDGFMMRRLAVELNIPFLTTLAAATAAVKAIRSRRLGRLDVAPLPSPGSP